MIKEWFKKRKAKKEQGLYDCGFSFMAGKLLRKNIDPDAILKYIRYVEEAEDFNNIGPFDYGIIDAVQAAINMGILIIESEDKHYIN
jgi:hypothetical protein